MLGFSFVLVNLWISLWCTGAKGNHSNQTNESLEIYSKRAKTIWSEIWSNYQRECLCVIMQCTSGFFKWQQGPERWEKLFCCSNKSAMIEFKECPEIPFWFAQTKFSLWGCTKKEIRVSKDSGSETESHNQWRGATMADLNAHSHTKWERWLKWCNVFEVACLVNTKNQEKYWQRRFSIIKLQKCPLT